MKRLIFTLTVCFIFCIAAQSAFAHKKHLYIKGIITDSASGERLPFATISLWDENKIFYHTIANADGEYAIPHVKPSCYTMKMNYVGYKSHQLLLDLENTSANDSVRQNIQMPGSRTVLKEVVITAVPDKNWYCCCCGYEILYCTNQRFRNDSITPVSQVAAPKWYNMNVYPNPTANRVTVNASLATVEPVQLQILDAAGKMVLQQQLDFRNQSSFTIDLANYRHGTYFFRMQYMGETHVEKVIKLQ